MNLVQKAHSIFISSSAKLEKTQRKNLCKYFQVSEVTEEFLLEKILEHEHKIFENEKEILALKFNSAMRHAISDAEVKKETDFSKRLWYEENKSEVDKFPPFVQSVLYKNLLPEKVLEKLPRGIVSEDILPHIQCKIRDNSYLKCDFGRASRINRGINSLSKCPITGRRVENVGRYSSRCWYTMFNYYADYTCIFSPDLRKMFYRYADGTEKTASVSPSGWVKLDGEVVKPLISKSPNKVRPKDVIRVFKNVLGKRNAIISVEYDRNTKLVNLKYRNEEYHVYLNPYKSTSSIEYTIQQAISAFKKRRSEKIDIELIERNSTRIYISLQDSLDSGNCVPISKEFARKMWQVIGAVGECAVRADIVLANRNDFYTRRAAQIAAERIV